MKKITLEDVNNAIIGTDIKILDSKTIINSNVDLRLQIESLTCYGVYIINYRNMEKFYVGMVHKDLLNSRLKTYVRDHRRKLIESIDIFITSNYHSLLLESLLIEKFKQELLNGQCDYDDDINDINYKFTLEYLNLCKKGDEINSNYWKINDEIYKEWKYRSENDKNWYELGPQARTEYNIRLKENMENEKLAIKNLINELNDLCKKFGRFNLNYEKDGLELGMLHCSYFGRITAIGGIYGIQSCDENVVYDKISDDIYIAAIQNKLRKKYKDIIKKAKKEL